MIAKAICAERPSEEPNLPTLSGTIRLLGGPGSCSCTRALKPLRRSIEERQRVGLTQPSHILGNHPLRMGNSLDGMTKPSAQTPAGPWLLEDED